MEITLQRNAFLLKYLCSSVSICGFPSSFVFQLPDLSLTVKGMRAAPAEYPFNSKKYACGSEPQGWCLIFPVIHPEKGATQTFAQLRWMPYHHNLKKRKAKITCKHCKGEFPAERYSCPRCGTPSDQKNVSSWLRKRLRGA